MGFNPNLSRFALETGSWPLHVTTGDHATHSAVLSPHLGFHLAVADRTDGVLGQLLQPSPPCLEFIALLAQPQENPRSFALKRLVGCEPRVVIKAPHALFGLR